MLGSMRWKRSSENSLSLKCSCVSVEAWRTKSCASTSEASRVAITPPSVLMTWDIDVHKLMT